MDENPNTCVRVEADRPADGKEILSVPANLSEARSLIQDFQDELTQTRAKRDHRLTAELSNSPSQDSSIYLFDLAPVASVSLDIRGSILKANQKLGELFGFSSESLQQKAWIDLIAEMDRPSIARWIRDASFVSQPAPIEARMVRKDLSVFFGLIEWTVVHRHVAVSSPDQPYILAAITDITAQKQVETQNKLNEARLQSLFALSQSTALSTSELLDQTLSEAIRLTGSKIGFIYIYDEKTRQFTLNSWSEEAMLQCRITEKQTKYELEKTGIWGEAVRQRKPILINDYNLPNPLKKGYPEGHVQLKRFLTIPIFSGSEITAVVGVANKEGLYDQSDIRQLTLLMDSSWEYVRRKKAESLIRENEEFYRTTLYSIGDGVITTDVNGCVQQMNRVGEELTGWTEGEARGKSVDDIFRIVNESSTRPSENPVRKVLAHGVPVGLANHTRLLSKHGAYRPIADSSSPIKNSTGETIGAVLVFRDQTTEYETEKSLRSAERKFRQLFENLTTGLALHEMIFDSSGRPVDYRFLEINPAFEHLTGLKADEVLGRTIREVIPSIEQSWLDKYGQVAATGEPVTFEDYNAALDRHYYVLAYSPQIGQFAVLFTDITDQKKAQNIIFQLNNDLEKRVRQRTADLESANRELEAFAYSVSHDLRAPLRAMKGFSEALAEDYAGQFDSTGRQYLDRIQNASLKMNQLIDDLLNLSRVNQFEMIRRVVNMSEIGHEIADSLQAQDPLRTIEWVIQENVSAFGDGHLLQIALQNLLENSFKFTGPCPAARIEFSCSEQGKEKIFTIQDNGVGFDMKDAQRLFGAFQRLHRDQDFPGTGIGLATVKRIIHRHGGRIWCDSGVNCGAVFHFTIGTPNTSV
jgi:PAS domain S-box-containing protein